MQTTDQNAILITSLKSLHGIDVALSIQAKGSCIKCMTEIELKNKIK